MPRRARPRRTLVVLTLAGLAALALPAAASAAPTVGTTMVATPPTVTSVSPGFGLTSGGTRVTVTGHGFTGVTSVRFGGENGSRLVVARDGMLRVTAPAHGAGKVRVRIIAPGRSSVRSSRAVFTYGATPDITEVVPHNGALAGGETATITGYGFTNAIAARFDGVDGANLAVVNDTTVTVTAPAHPTGSVRVRVIVPGSSTPQSMSARFTYVGVPTVTGLSSSTGSTTGNTTVTITGTGFTDNASVNFGSTLITMYTIDSDTQIRAVTPPAPAGAVNVTVTTEGGTSTTTSVDQFTFVAPPAVSGVTPQAGSTAGGTTVTITGTGLAGVTSVTFAGVSGTALTVLNDTQLTIATPAHASGAVDVIVTSPYGNDEGTDAFTYMDPPMITDVSPTTGTTAGGTSVTITGSGFTGTTDVRFGTPRAQSFTVVNDNTITAVTPAHAAGAVNVLVEAPGGNATSINGYMFG